MKSYTYFRSIHVENGKFVKKSIHIKMNYHLGLRKADISTIDLLASCCSGCPLYRYRRQAAVVHQAEQ